MGFGGELQHVGCEAWMCLFLALLIVNSLKFAIFIKYGAVSLSILFMSILLVNNGKQDTS